MVSIFSRIVAGEIPSYKVAETANCLAFLDVMPLVPGHVLVIPKQEIDSIFDIDDALLAELHQFAKRVAHGVKAVVPCRKVGMAVIGLEVPHAHIHLIPMQAVSDMNFGNAKLSLPKEQMESLQEAISAAISAESGV
jgi:histidine triad (HIT) family protein